MNMTMTADTKTAGRSAGSPATVKYNTLDDNYQKFSRLSRAKLKNLVGSALLFGDKQNPAFWASFEVLFLLWINS